MASLCTENRKYETTIDRDDAKRYKPTCREDINALFSSGQIPKGEIHYFFNPFFDDTNTKTGTNESEYWGIRGIKNAYNALVTGGVTADKIHLPFFASNDTHEKYKNKKTKEDNQSKLPTNIDNDIFKSNSGLLENIFTDKTAFPIDYRDWNMIINLLKYDGNPEGTDGEINDDATDAEEKFFGPFQYACGDTLPGGYFDADEMRKEVTFVGLYFNNDNNKLTDEQKKKIKDLNWEEIEPSDLERFDRYIEDTKLKQDNAQTSVLRGFIVVKDLSHKTHNYEEEVKVKKTKEVEKYLYVEGLCSNARGVGKLLLNDVINAGKTSEYEGTKLAALTVVISYYYKLGFRFYKKEKEITTEGEKTLIEKVNEYLDKFLIKNKTDYPSIAHFKNVQKAFGKDCDDNDIFTIEDYHYEGLNNVLKLDEINTGASWGRRGKPRCANKHTIFVDEKGNKIDQDANKEKQTGMQFKAYNDEAMGDMGYYMYLKNAGKKSGGGKNLKKRTKKKARRRKRKRTKRKRRRKRKRTRKRRRRRTKKRR